MSESTAQPVAQGLTPAQKRRPEPREFTRHELHELVWTEPIRKLAVKFGVSDVGLAKACRRAYIPVPERGYWAKLRSGKKAERTALPLRPPGVSEQVRIGHESYYWDSRRSEEEILAPIPPPPTFPEPISDVRARAVAMVGKVRIPKISVVSHKVISAVLREDEQRREKHRNSLYPSSWDSPLYDTPLQRRRLTILNALFLALQRCECKPSPLRQASMRGEAQSLSIAIGDQEINFTLELIVQKRTKGSANADAPGPDKLQLDVKTYSDFELPRSHWQDEEGRKLEEQLTEIAVEFLVSAEIHYREGAIRAHQWRIEQKAQLEEQARRRQTEAERKERERQEALQRQRVQRLLGEAIALRNAQAIREYVDEVRDEVSRSLPSISREDVDAWATWALAQADGIDPVRSRAFLQPDVAGEAADQSKRVSSSTASNQ